ncbi:hypothetical protein SO802_002035 [Lithocarpus litseifolius]|uniref:Uncharacterized protein n=1 Tax=Lithocarpus litseifolius TaxID=425828 RepID=A0AAW2DX07_9ROSI
MFQGKEEIRPVDVAQISVVCWMLFIGLLVHIWNLDVYHIFTNATFYLMPSANYQVTAILCNLERAIIINFTSMFPLPACIQTGSQPLLLECVLLGPFSLCILCRPVVDIDFTTKSSPFPLLVHSIFFKSVALTCYM